MKKKLLLIFLLVLVLAPAVVKAEYEVGKEYAICSCQIEYKETSDFVWKNTFTFNTGDAIKNLTFSEPGLPNTELKTDSSIVVSCANCGSELIGELDKVAPPLNSSYIKEPGQGMVSGKCVLQKCTFVKIDAGIVEIPLFSNCSNFVPESMVFITKFQGQDNPYEYNSASSTLSTPIETDKPSNISCAGGCDGGFAKIQQDVLGSGKAKLLIEPSKAPKYNQLLHIDLQAEPTGPGAGLCVGPSSTPHTGYYLKIKFDCAKQITDADGCSKPENETACRKKCENDYCRLEDGFCKAIKNVTKEFNKNAGYFQSQYPVPEGYNGPLPPCAFSGTCRDTNDLVSLIIRFGSGFFAILGSFAFAFFIYGGFTIMLSMGNAEKVKKGQQTIVAAVIGLFIAFSAYLAIDFVLDALGVASDFRGIK